MRNAATTAWGNETRRMGFGELVIDFGGMRPLKGFRVLSRSFDHFWIHNWIFADGNDLVWFNQLIRCRFGPDTQVHFVGWDGDVATWTFS